MCHVACNRHRLHVTCCMSKVRGGDWSRSWWPINITSFHWRSSHGKNYKHIYLHNERILSHWSLAESPDQEKPARRFITRTLHDFSWRYFVVSITKIFRVTLITITMYPCHQLHPVPIWHSMPPSLPCTTVRPLSLESHASSDENQNPSGSESEVDIIKMSQLPAPATFSIRNPISNLVVTKKTARVW